MATDETETGYSISEDQRPGWPYELWVIDYETTNHTDNDSEKSLDTSPENDTQGHGSVAATSLDDAKCADDKGNPEHGLDSSSETGKEDVSGDETSEEEEYPDHWSDELDYTIHGLCPIKTLIQATMSPDISNTDEALQLKDVVLHMLEATLRDLKPYKLFQGSSLLPVGSMAENTKIGKADEFDFAVILPTLAQEEYMDLLNKTTELVTDPRIMDLIGEIWKGDLRSASICIQMLLRELWSDQMMAHVPEGWTIINPSGHSDSHSVAATFHLQHKLDKFMVDLDVCFWVPFDKVSLLKLRTDKYPQKHYLSKHCLDKNGLVYVVLPHDTNISIMINTVRFAMSLLERAALQEYGPDNVRLQCYKTCKCLVSVLLPKLKKKEECNYCFDSLVSSYCLKNIVLYMAANHKEDKYWIAEKLPNRVLEVFNILTFCMKINAGQISAYYTPYQLSIDTELKYNPSTRSVTNTALSWYTTTDIPCVLPDLKMIKEQFTEDAASLKALSNYEAFLSTTEWRFPEVIWIVTELLTNLMQVDECLREELVGNPGWNFFELSLPECTSFVMSVDTKL